jgi:hypothetical protein
VNSSISAVVSALQNSILKYRDSSAAQAQIAHNAAIDATSAAHSPAVSGTTSQGATNQTLLTALQGSLQDISASLSASSNVSQSVASSVQALLQTIAQIIASLLATNPGTGTTPPAGGGTTVGTASIPGSFRYFKISTTEQGWVSWREIEAYDTNGQKIAIASAAASAVYDGQWQSPTVPPQVAANAIDGRSDTVWNAGETAPGCSQASYGINCPSSMRSAYIILDLGSVKNVSKIRLQENGNSTTEVDTIATSNDGVTYQTVATLRAPFSDQQWIEYPVPPPPTFTADPSVSVTINGTSTFTVTSASDTIHYAWNTANADSITATFMGGAAAPFDTADPATDNLCGIRFNRDILPYSSFVATDLPTSAVITLPPGAGSSTAAFSNAWRCPVIRTYHFQIQAKQVGSGKTATASTTLKILAAPNSSFR